MKQTPLKKINRKKYNRQRRIRPDPHPATLLPDNIENRHDRRAKIARERLLPEVTRKAKIRYSIMIGKEAKRKRLLAKRKQ